MTLLGAENSLEAETAHSDTHAAVGEKIDRRNKEMAVDLEQKERPITAFLQPLRIPLRELLNLRLR